jgi:glutathione S-transferase
MDFYMNPASSSCRKVESVAKQLGIEMNYKVVDLAKGENRTPAFLRLNPNGKVPVLVDGDVTLWESNAIQCYLASKKDSELWPKSNLRYDIMRWQSWELAHFGAAAGVLVFERIVKALLGLGAPDAARCSAAESDFKRYAGVLDAHLNGKRFIVADQLTLADFCLASALNHADSAKMPLQGSSHIRRWLRALDEQPGWRASAPAPM